MTSLDTTPDMWLVSCYGLFEMRELVSKDMDKAKIEAMVILQVILDDSLHELTAKPHGPRDE